MSTIPKTLLATDTSAIHETLKAANDAFTALRPGERPDRQPVHVVYGGAQLFNAGMTRKLGEVALRNLARYAPRFTDLAKAVGLAGADTLPDGEAEVAALAIEIERDPEQARVTRFPAWLAHTVFARVKGKLEQEAVEDFRIDFEDGFGNRPDPEEDAAAENTAREVKAGMDEGALPAFIGIRIKPFNEEMKHRSVRTLDIFLTTLLQATGGKLPSGFCVTLPKVTIPEQVAALVTLFEVFEERFELPGGSLEMEIMIETPGSIFDTDGRASMPALIRAAQGRCRSAHLGTYDYTAGCSITAAYQAMDHAVCDFAKHVMQVTLAGTGIWLSDGATNILPVGPHRAAKDGPPLTDAQERENRQVVHNAWRVAFDHTRHSLKNGYYQGWDLHPGQLICRYAAVFSFFLENMAAASERLSNFVGKAAQATLVGDVFDDAATGQGLLNYFLRALNCGAISEQEALATGLTVEEIRGRSFLKILEARQNA
ncbi:MAG: DUF6986 family protein [Planctomycetota bacterium]|jgi:hypothetical protein